LSARPVKKMRIGLLGVANPHADIYARCVTSIPSAELVGVYEKDERRGRDFARKHRVEYRRGVDSLLSDVDAVVVTSENTCHHQLTIAAARAGRHILCEKPIATTRDHAEEMRREVEKAKVKFQTCHVMRYHTVASVVKGLVDAGRVGDVLALVGLNRVKSKVPEESWAVDRRQSAGGAVMDHTSHLADMMRWYSGSEVSEVYCEIGRKINPRLSVEDNFLTTVTFESGVLGHMDGSWTYPAGYPSWGGLSMEVLGSKGVLCLDAFRQNVYFAGTTAPDDRVSWQSYGCDPYAEMVRSFVECVQLGRQPLASIEDGVRGLEITLASYDSFRRGKPVKLSTR
jgi:UDP-N-acetylglucosamine 3-dehydrogenase